MANYVGSMAAELKKTITKPLMDTKVATEEETKERKARFLNILDKSATEFLSKLDKGKIVINSTADLERIIKLTLLVSGEANSIVGKEGMETKETQNLDALNVNIEDISELLDKDDPEIKAVFDKLFYKYNDENDKLSNS